MGRPRKDDEHRRTERLAFRLTQAEIMQIERSAIAAGVTASELARRQALKGRVIVQQQRALDHAVFDELRRIGVNLNQLARIANQTGRVPRELARLCAALEQILLREIEQGSPKRSTQSADSSNAVIAPPEPGHGP